MPRKHADGVTKCALTCRRTLRLTAVHSQQPPVGDGESIVYELERPEQPESAHVADAAAIEGHGPEPLAEGAAELRRPSVVVIQQPSAD